MAVGQHLRRALSGAARRSPASATEAAQLSTVGIADPLMQGYMVWRRSVLIVAIPFSILSAVLAVRDLTARNFEGYSALGVVAAGIVALAVPLLTVTVVVAALTWHQPRRSGRVLLAGWAISMFAPLFAAMLPLDWLVTSSLEAVTGIDSGEREDELFARIAVSVQYALVLLPSLLSFPSGLVRGAARVKRMLPASTISGWVLVIMTPVYAVFFVLALILVQHLAGNAVLLLGAMFLAASPFVHLAAGRLYIYPLTTEREVRALDRVQRWAGVVSSAGMAMIVVWALTATIGDTRIVGWSDALLDPLGAVLSALELVARVLVTSVVFSYLLLQVSESAWRHDRGYEDPDAYERHELQMAEVERTLRATGDRLG